MNTHVLTTVLATVLLMLAVAEAVVVETARLTDSSGKFPSRVTSTAIKLLSFYFIFIFVLRFSTDSSFIHGSLQVLGMTIFCSNKSEPSDSFLAGSHITNMMVVGNTARCTHSVFCSGFTCSTGKIYSQYGIPPLHPHGAVFGQFYPVDDIDGRDGDVPLAVVALGCTMKTKRKKEERQEDTVYKLAIAEEAVFSHESVDRTGNTE